MDLRDRFFLPEPSGAIELRAFTHGLMPRSVPAMMERFTEDWRRRGVDAWNHVPNHWRPASGEPVGWWTLPAYLGDHFVAPLLGAPPGTCILQPNVHHAVQQLFSAPGVFADGIEVITTEAEFPSVLHSARRWADLLDLSLTIVPAGSDGFVDRSAVLDAISSETALVALSHVGFTTGERLPDDFLQAVAGKTHAAGGGLFVLDGYHSTGTMPLSVEGLGADLYVGGLLKEGSGSSGNAFVYLRKGLDLQPRLTGWFGDADPFAFHSIPTPHPDVRRRFLGGTHAVAPLYHAVEGARILLDAGLDQIRADALEKTAYCIDRADRAGLVLRSPRPAVRRSSMVLLEVDRADRLCTHLKQQHIYTDSRKGRYLRMAPFVWNTFDELERTFDTIEDALAAGTYRRTERPAPAGPVT